MAVGDRRYASRQEIDESSPSRRDGIDLRMEKYLRISYSNFLQDMGMRLQVPQLTIATAILFCHRFFLRQSHLRNDSKTVATSCMVLAVKVEETPRKLRDIILVSFEIIHELDRETAFCRIKQKEVYNQQKMLILLGERVVLATLGFDLNVHHPYNPLVEAIQKFEVAEKSGLLQVAWNYVNDGLRTSLCLQYKPQQIAAAAISLAAKRLKVKLPFDHERFWQQEFEVTPSQLEEIKNQLIAVYEQNWVFVPQLKGSELEGSPEEEGDYGGEAAGGNDGDMESDFGDGKDDWNDNSMEQMRCNMVAFLGRCGGADDVKGEDHDRSSHREAGDRVYSGRRIGSEHLLAM